MACQLSLEFSATESLSTLSFDEAFLTCRSNVPTTANKPPNTISVSEPMPRAARVVLPGVPHHVTHRGNNRMRIFDDDQDCLVFRQLVLNYSKKLGCDVHSYVLMGNHVHLLVTPREPNSLSRFMQRVAMMYSRYFNKRYGRTGCMWEGRYGSSVIESARYYFTCCRYIELNPVRAQLAANPLEYRWSSFHRNALGTYDPLITPHSLYDALSENPRVRFARYQAIFSSHLDSHDIKAIRSATSSGAFVGGDNFRSILESALGRSLFRNRHGGDRRSADFKPVCA